MIEILDCTLRDGGYYTKWDFSEQLTNNYFAAMEKLPISYVEIGYRSLADNCYEGEFSFCPNYLLDEIRSKLPTTKIGIMLNEKEVKIEDLQRLLSFNDGTVDFVRMAVDPANFERAKIVAQTIKKMGFEVGFNVMYMSKWESDYPDFISQLVSLNGIVDSFAMVDSYGSMYPENTRRITKLIREKLNCKLGFHGHNNIELAFANTLAAIDGGCDIIDSTITGMGRGAGNLKTELLLAYLSSEKKISVDFNALSATVTDFDQMRETHGWGTNLPYMVSGFGSLPQKDVMDWVTRRFYSINSILRALHNMKDKKGDNIKLPIFNADKQQFDLVLIIGGGPSGANSAKPLKALLRKYHNKKICIVHASSKNAGYYNDVNIPQFFCLVGNEGYRLEKVFINFSLDNVQCVLPPYPRKMGTYIPDQLVGKSYELAQITFSELYQDSHTALALQTAIELGANIVYIAGYDGYEGLIGENERILTAENEYLLKQLVKQKPDIDVSTITSSKYQGIKNRSVYRLLID